MKKLNFTLKMIGLQYLQAILLILAIPAIGFGQLPAGTYSVGPTGDYASLGEAFDVIKSDSIAGNIILELQNSHVESNLAIDGVGYSTATITIRPEAGAQFVLFDGRTHFTGGSQNMIFDGRPGGEGDPFPGGNPVMIFRLNDNTNTNGAIHQQGAGALTVRYVEVRADSKYGIYSQFANTITIEDCRIRSFQNGFVPNPENLNTEAIRTLFSGGNITIRNNRIEGWKGSDGFTELGGIFMLHPNQPAGDPVTWIVENNSIILDKPANVAFCMGIRLNTSNGWTFENNEYKVRHNTILLRGTNSNDDEGAVSGAFSRQANAALPAHTMEVKNNIFVNQIQNTGGQSVTHGALWIRADAGGVLENADFDYNNYRSADGIASVGNPAASVRYASLADWQAFSGQDENTTNVNPPFTNAATGDLSLNVPTDGSETWFIGTGLGVAEDILGTSRKPFTPTKGAYEVVFPCIPGGVYTVAADPGAPGSADYASLEDAFQDIQLKCLDGEVVLELESGFTADNLSLVGAGDPNYTVTVRPEANALFTLFSGRTHITGGSENIVFDGRPGGTGDPFPGGNTVMIFRQNDNTNANGAIHHQGAGALTVRYVEVRADSKYGIYSQFGNTITIENCRIRSFQNGYVPNPDNINTEAIRTFFSGGNITIRNNLISGWKGADNLTELGGIFMLHPNQTAGAPVTWVVENNSIVLDKPANVGFCMGIRLNTSNGWTFENNQYLVRHNTILLRGTNSNDDDGAVTGAFARQANAALPAHSMEVKNNIFVNLIGNTGGQSVSHGALWIRADAGGVLENADFDYNDYYSAQAIASVGNPAAGSTEYAGLAGWQSFSGQDGATTNVNPAFADPGTGNLALDPAALAPDDLWVLGTDLGVATDINGVPRTGNAPTKGAYEQDVVSGLRDIQDLSGTLRVFPNPAGAMLNVQMDNPMRGRVRFAVTNIMGQELRSFEATKSQDFFRMEASLEGLPKGLLFVVAGSNGYQAVQKVIRQ
ncbi:MAG: hypothetical protein H6558_13375 [Lewinellaceae bacterium]|nr:hypothetical protein [Lewinellaceae bacterium]